MPGKELRRLVDGRKGEREVDAYEALELAAYFRVSYAALLYRLSDERLISREQYNVLGRYSPRKMAEQLQMNPEEFEVPEHDVVYLERYPVSVLERVWSAVDDGELTVSQASDLLEIQKFDLQAYLRTFSNPPESTSEEQRQLDEFPRRHLSKERPSGM